MDIKKKIVELYEVAGKEFTSLEEAENYKNKLEKLLTYTFYRVAHEPDLTEGRGYSNKMYPGVEKNYCNNTVIHYLCEKLGKPLAFVQGVAPMDNWVLSEPYTFDNLDDLLQFLNEEVLVGIGDYRKPKNCL